MLALILLSGTNLTAQTSELPYRVIPDYPESFTAETVAARMLDGLGFRYYWATEGLRPEDLSYKPGEEARSTRETLEHIYGLTLLTVNSTKNVVNSRIDVSGLTFEELRAKTLENISKASEFLKGSEAALDDLKCIFPTQDGSTVDYPFWNLVNGPIADALWHVGQVVSFRRSSGNPLNSKVSVFNGTVRD